MTETEITGAARELGDILETEKAFLLAGRAREAADLSTRKLAALEAFEAAASGSLQQSLSPAGRRLIAEIARLSEENAQLFRSVRNGLQSLIARFEKPPEDAFVGCYRQGGAAVPFTKATGTYQRKV